MAKQWEEFELKAVVNVYLKMLDLEIRGKKFNKKAMFRKLVNDTLCDRTVDAAEFMAHQVAWALKNLGRPQVNGLEATTSSNKGTIKRIEHLLTSTAPTADFDELEERTERLRKQFKSNMPKTDPEGSRSPRVVSVESRQYARNPKVKAWVLVTSGGICEACGSPAPFTNSVGDPFLEVHHMIPLAEKGPDITSNAVALCPNCHRRFHYGSDRENFRIQVWSRVKRLVRT